MKLVLSTWIKILSTSSQKGNESKLFLENSEAEGLHGDQNPLLIHKAKGQANRHLSLLNPPNETCTAAVQSGNSDTETEAKEARIRGMPISASLSCPSQPHFATPSFPQEGIFTVKCLYL